MRVIGILGLLFGTTCATSASHSPLDHVPANAVAVVLIGSDASKVVSNFWGADAEMTKELSDYFIQKVGVDLTRVRRVVAFATDLEGQTPKVAAWLELEGSGPLKLEKVGSHQGTDVYSFIEQGRAARVPDGLVIGEQSAVEQAIEVASGKREALGEKSPLGTLRRAGAADFLVGIDASGIKDRQAQAMLGVYGVKDAVLELHGNKISVSLGGEPSKLEGLRTLFHQARDMALAGLDAARKNANQASGLEGAGAIVGYYQARRMFRELEPQINGNRLVAELQTPKMDSIAIVPVVGIMAAVAIPAFMKYIRRSKTTEASMNVRKLFDASVAYYESERVDSRGRPLPQRFPPSAPLTPNCCAFPGGKCPPNPKVWAHPAWQALNFAIDDPSYYRYEYKSSGEGTSATFTASAYGDLNCDGVWSTYERTGSVDPQGNVTGGAGLYVVNDIE